MPTIEPQKPEAKQLPQVAKEELQVAVVNCINSSGFDSEAQTVIVGKNVEAAFETDRGVQVIRYVGREGGIYERYLIPWSNIKSVKYAPIAKSKA